MSTRSLSPILRASVSAMAQSFFAGALCVTPAIASPPAATGAEAAVEDLGSGRPGEDWPTFLGPRQEPLSTETGLLERWPLTGPPVLWHQPIGEGYSAPSVARGRLFVFDRVGDRARLRALHAESGEVLWEAAYPSVYEDAFDFSNGPRAAPVVDGDRVYVHGVDGRLRCHRIQDGTLVWERDLEAEYGVVTNFFGAASTPAIYDDLLLAVVGGSPPGEYDIHQGKVLPNGSGLVAFDKLTGEERYRAVDELSSYASPIVRPLHGRDRLIWLARGGLVLLDPRTGAVDLEFPFRARKVYSVNAATPVVAGNRIFITESYELGGALLEVKPSLASVDVVWRDPRVRNQALASHWMTPVLHEGTLYGSSGEKSGSAQFRAVAWSTGEIQWSKPGLRRSSALFADGRLIVLSEYGTLLLIDATPEEYRELARVELEGEVDGERRKLLRFPAWNAPVLSHGILYLRGGDRLVALDLLPRSAGE